MTETDKANIIKEAQEIFEKKYVNCFWFLNKDLKVTLDDVPTICSYLMKYGNKEDYIVARKLCLSLNSNQ